MTKEIELAAEEEYPEKPKSNVAMYNPIQRRCQQAFIKGAQWMATRDRWVSVDEVHRVISEKKVDLELRLKVEQAKIFGFDDADRFKSQVSDGVKSIYAYAIVLLKNLQAELPSPPQSKNNG